MQVQAEVSLYALNHPDMVQVIVQFLDAVQRPGLQVEPGPMSTLISGPCALVFQAIGQGFEAVGVSGKRLLVVKFLAS